MAGGGWYALLEDGAYSHVPNGLVDLLLDAEVVDQTHKAALLADEQGLPAAPQGDRAEHDALQAVDFSIQRAHLRSHLHDDGDIWKVLRSNKVQEGNI